MKKSTLDLIERGRHYRMTDEDRRRQHESLEHGLAATASEVATDGGDSDSDHIATAAATLTQVREVIAA